jgi:hypothetical protein
MTDVGADPLPLLLQVSEAFNQRLPSQRLIDLVVKMEGQPFNEIAQTQPFRLVAFRALCRDFPLRDPNSLWLHAYDCEVELVALDPTNVTSPAPAPLSAVSGG